MNEMRVSAPVDEDCPPAPVPDGALARELAIINRKGLHARASAKFVQTVDRFEAEVHVTRCGETVGGRSIMGLLTLAAAQGTTITVTARGDDAEACIEAITALLADRFGEEE
ncbi:HPr family phosphocarrier protein [Chelatococcus sp. SYSU_G07232]|uniref:HPr family phosphocarrier protein n=1 Tax=Chelatococcus albus TaxID=3047466 RepID=A0ABT7AL94_9HYPH|nr:HPr family phosphocarrier protein [Chelatococcus sp. SYSU_G07232]MDJ1160145.1 HPr family phosphocarrier protein [Chelatococcus sp. SYSU_G07232]